MTPKNIVILILAILVWTDIIAPPKAAVLTRQMKELRKQYNNRPLELEDILGLLQK